MPDKLHVTVGIIGLNRVTASVGLMLKAHSADPKGSAKFTVIGNDEDAEVMKTAQKSGVVDQTKMRIADAIKEAQVVIVDQPVGDLDFVYGELGYSLRPGAVVLDLSPIKRPVIEFAKTHFPRSESGQPQSYLVGLFPVVHFANLYDFRRGIEAADEKYLIGGEMFIAPDASCPPEAVKLASDLTDICQMKPRFLDPGEFDALSDFTETMPVALSTAMFNAIAAADGRKDIERSLNPAFAALIQNLRAHNPDDITDLLLSDADSTRRHINDLIRALAGLRDLLDKDNPDALSEHIRRTIATFDDWEARREKGEWEKPVGEMPGGISMFGNMFGGVIEKRLSKFEEKAETTHRKRKR